MQLLSSGLGFMSCIYYYLGPAVCVFIAMNQLNVNHVTVISKYLNMNICDTFKRRIYLLSLS